MVIVCCVSIQEKVRRSPNGFVRNGNKRERVCVGGGGGRGGSGVTRDELENELAGRSTLNQRHRCVDLPSIAKTKVSQHTCVFDSMWTFQPVRFRARLSWPHFRPPPPSLSLSLIPISDEAVWRTTNFFLYIGPGWCIIVRATQWWGLWC